MKIREVIYKNWVTVSNGIADEALKWADAIRKTFDDGGVDELITTRRMVHIIRAFAIFGNKTKAVNLCLNRFDAQTKAAFIDLMDKMAEPEPEPFVSATSPLDEIPF